MEAEESVGNGVRFISSAVVLWRRCAVELGGEGMIVLLNFIQDCALTVIHEKILVEEIDVSLIMFSY